MDCIDHGVPKSWTRLSDFTFTFKRFKGISLAVQWLRFYSMQGDKGLIPGQGNKIPHALLPKNQDIKQKQYCTNSIKTLEMVHIKIYIYIFFPKKKTQIHVQETQYS